MNTLSHAIVAGIGAMLAIATLGFAQELHPDIIWVMAPFGATAVLLFGLPASPLAQPKNVIGGHMITSIIGVVFATFFAINPISLAVATGLGVSAMMITKTTHPPAGANPLLIMLTGQTWSFLFTPVLIGAVALVIIGRLFQRSQRVFQNNEKSQ